MALYGTTPLIVTGKTRLCILSADYLYLVSVPCFMEVQCYSRHPRKYPPHDSSKGRGKGGVSSVATIHGGLLKCETQYSAINARIVVIFQSGDQSKLPNKSGEDIKT